MRIHRIQNRILQWFYKPPGAARAWFPAETLATMDALDKQIAQHITPLLAGLTKPD